MDEEYAQNKTALRRPVRRIKIQTERPERIKSWMGWAMAILALCVDAAQAILTAVGIGLVVGPIISAVAYFAFWVLFKMLGVSFTGNPKNLLALGGSSILEFLLSFLPAFSAGVIAVILITMAEDKGGIIGKAAGAMQNKMT